MRQTSKRILSIILVVILIPLTAILVEIIGSYISAARAYETAVTLFESGDHAQAQPIFQQVNGYADSGMYAQYILGESFLAQNEFTAASITYQALSGAEFLDSQQLFDYTQGLRAQEMGKVREAMILFDRAGIRDSAVRFAALQSANPDIDINKEEIPAHAKENGFAFIAKANVTTASAPWEASPTDGTGSAKPFELWDVVWTLAFDWDASGKLWAKAALAPIMSDDEPGESIGYLPLADLYLMTEADEVSYIAALKSAPPAPTDHYAYVTTNTVNVRPQAKKSGSVAQVNKKDIVEMLQAVTGDDGAPWTNIITARGLEGFILTQYLQPMTAEEEAAHRSSLGIPATAARPRITPIPTAAAPAPTPMPIARETVVVDRPALPDDLTLPDVSEEQFDRALWLLSVGLNTFNQVSSLETAISILETLGDYESAAVYLRYARLLLLIEQGDYDAADAHLASMVEDGFFLKQNLSVIPADALPIPTANDLHRYILARRDITTAEDAALALSALDGLRILDAADRMIAVSNRLADAPSIEDTVQGIRPRDLVKMPIQYSSFDLRSVLAPWQIQWADKSVIPQDTQDYFQRNNDWIRANANQQQGFQDLAKVHMYVTGDYESALDTFRIIREQYEPYYFWGYVKSCKMLLDLQRYDEALEFAKTMLDMLSRADEINSDTLNYPGNQIDAYIFIASAHNYAGDFEHALEYLQKSEELIAQAVRDQSGQVGELGLVDLMYERAAALVGLGRYEEAMMWLNGFVYGDHDTATQTVVNAYALKAYVEEQLGELEAAQADRTEAANLMPDQTKDLGEIVYFSYPGQTITKGEIDSVPPLSYKDFTFVGTPPGVFGVALGDSKPNKYVRFITNDAKQGYTSGYGVTNTLLKKLGQAYVVSMSISGVPDGLISRVDTYHAIGGNSKHTNELFDLHFWDYNSRTTMYKNGDSHCYILSDLFTVTIEVAKTFRGLPKDAPIRTDYAHVELISSDIIDVSDLDIGQSKTVSLKVPDWYANWQKTDTLTITLTKESVMR
ncbi:hypothetical protein FACS1894184_04990 [Clostridia bacterium]|nr:hypothetical protein FACS1894184_04990 [Clostridia bacterium]